MWPFEAKLTLLGRGRPALTWVKPSANDFALILEEHGPSPATPKVGANFYNSPSTVMTSWQSGHWKAVSFGSLPSLGMTRASFIFAPQCGHEREKWFMIR